MKSLSCGRYRTANGSTMKITGKRSTVSFDWFEEDACIDCKVEAYDEDGFLVWDCDYCGGGRAELLKIQEG